MNKQVKKKMKTMDAVMGKMRNQPLGKYSNISVTDYERQRERKEEKGN